MIGRLFEDCLAMEHLDGSTTEYIYPPSLATRLLLELRTPPGSIKTLDVSRSDRGGAATRPLGRLNKWPRSDKYSRCPLAQPYSFTHLEQVRFETGSAAGGYCFVCGRRAVSHQPRVHHRKSSRTMRVGKTLDSARSHRRSGSRGGDSKLRAI